MIRSFRLFSAFAPSQNPFFHSRRTSGNIFALLFGAVALTGVLAAVGMQTLTGPVTTITRVTQKNIADTQLLMNARIIINASTDPDGDNMMEAAPWPTIGAGETPPANGGFLPTDLGLSLTDPWGTKYGYCVWDHGTSNTSGGRITGDATNTADQQPALAIISAGPDKIFQTPCPTNTSTIMDVLRQGDDLVQDFTYAEASANSNGLWTINTSDAAKAELKPSDGTSPAVISIDRNTGIGDFVGITTDTLAAKTDAVAMAGGLKLDSEVGVPDAICGVAMAGVMRYNTTISMMEICNGAVWTPAGSDVWRRDGTNVYLKEAGDSVGIGTDAPTQKLDVQGNTNTSGNITVGGTGTVTGNLIVNTDAFFVDATNKRIGVGTAAPSEALEVAGNAYIVGNSTITQNLAVDGTTLFVDSSADRVGVGTASPDALLHVEGGGNMGTLGAFDVGDAVFHVGDGNANLYMDGRAILSDNSLLVGTTGSNSLQFFTNELSRMTIAADGFVSIGGGASVGGILNVGGATTLSSTLTVSGNTAIDTDTLVVDAANNTVGIGVASPQAKLDVDGGIKIGTHGACNFNGVIQYDAGLKKMQLCVDGTWTNISAIDKLDDIGDVEVPSPNSNDVLTWDGTRWVAKNIVDLGPAAVNPAGVDGSVQFKDDGDLAADPANFHWDLTNHRLGIGTNNPQETLHVEGNTRVTGDLAVGEKLDVTGAATFADTLTVTGNAIFDTSTLFVNATGNNVGIGTLLPDPSAVLDLSSTSAGFLTPRMSTTQRNAIGTPATGLIIFNSQTNKLQIYDGLNWLNVGTAAGLGSSMIDGWPDAINCGAVGQPTIYYLTYAPFSDGKFYYRNIYDAGDRSVWFNADKTYDNKTTAELGCNGKSINQLYAENRAFNFVGGASAGEGVGMVTDVPDVLDCGAGGTQRFVFLQTSTGTSYTYSLSSGANAVGMQVSFAALPSGAHTSTTNTAGWTNANGCDGKTLTQLASEDRVFFLVGGSSGGGGSTVSAAGLDGYIQFNTANVMDAESTLMWDKTNDRLSVGMGASPLASIHASGGIIMGTDAVCSASKLGMIAFNGGQFRICRDVSGTPTLVTLLDATFTEQDPKIGTTTSGRWCSYNGTHVTCTENEPVLEEVDPKVGTLDSGKWCTTNGTTITCTEDAPVTSAGSDTQVIFNDGGTLSGESDFTWNKTTNYLNLGTASTVEAGGVQLKLVAGDPPVAGPNTAGGGNGQLQFNIGGQLQGDNALNWDNSNKWMGIGTATPQRRLHVVSPNNTGVWFSVADNHATTGWVPAISLQNLDATNNNRAAIMNFNAGGGINAGIEFINLDHTMTGGGEIAFATRHAGGWTQKMYINSAGNVGIGEINPQHMLHIKGSHPYIAMQDTEDPNGSYGTITAYQNGTLFYDANLNNTATPGSHTFRADGGAKMLMALQNTGSVQIGSASGTLSKLFVYDNSVNHTVFIRQDSGPTYNLVNFSTNGGVTGSITSNGSTTAYNTSSDRRLKDNIADTHFGLDDLMKLQVRDYTFRADAEHKQETGFIAQEINAIYPGAVTTNGDDGKGALTEEGKHWVVDYGKITPLITKAIQDLKVIVDGLLAKVAELFDMVGKLAAENKELRTEIGSLKAQNADILKRLESLEAKEQQ